MLYLAFAAFALLEVLPALRSMLLLYVHLCKPLLALVALLQLALLLTGLVIIPVLDLKPLQLTQRCK